MRIGIFGGSFNPVHNGHLKLAREALSELNLSRVIFVPSHQTPLKGKAPLLPGRQRVGLLKIALKGIPDFHISLCEIRRGGVSYTVDTLKYFKRKFGKDNVLYFLCGADTLRNLRRWKSWKEVARLCRFIVMSRPGFLMRPAAAPSSVFFLPFDALPVSATEIRRKGLQSTRRKRSS